MLLSNISLRFQFAGMEFMQRQYEDNKNPKLMKIKERKRKFEMMKSQIGVLELPMQKSERVFEPLTKSEARNKLEQLQMDQNDDILELL